MLAWYLSVIVQLMCSCTHFSYPFFFFFSFFISYIFCGSSLPATPFILLHLRQTWWMTNRVPGQVRVKVPAASATSCSPLWDFTRDVYVEKSRYIICCIFSKARRPPYIVSKYCQPIFHRPRGSVFSPECKFTVINSREGWLISSLLEVFVTHPPFAATNR